MKKTLYIIAAFIIISFSSCNSETDILTIATDDAVLGFTGSQDDIIDYIGQNAYDELTQILNFPINTGSTPPTINGNFLMNEIGEYVVSTSLFDGPFGYYVEYLMNSQDNDSLTINYTGRFMNYGLDGVPFTSDDELNVQETGIGRSFVSGNSVTGDFTVIVRTQVTTDRVDVIALSGRLSASGNVENMEYGYVYFDNGDPDTGIIEGSARLRDWDGISEQF
jgi:hypothetical protein